MAPIFSLENLNRKELIQELLYGISNKQLRQLIEYKNTLMAAPASARYCSGHLTLHFIVF